MTILSAQFANPDQTAVLLQTAEAGAVLISLEDAPDCSGGWRDAYLEFSESNLTQPFQP